QRGEERQRESGGGAAVREAGRGAGVWGGGARRRLHRAGGRRLRHRPHRESAERHAAHRGVPGRGVAPVGVASEAESRRDEMGIDTMKRVEDLQVKLFADGAEKAGMLEMYAKPYIK